MQLFTVVSNQNHSPMGLNRHSSRDNKIASMQTVDSNRYNYQLVDDTPLRRPSFAPNESTVLKKRHPTAQPKVNLEPKGGLIYE